MLKHYTPDDYNQYNVLHVPLVLSLVTAYLLKHYFIVAVPVMAQLPLLSVMADPLSYFVPSAKDSGALLLYSCIPALLVLMSMARRVPDCHSRLLRWSWKNGKHLLLSSALMEMILIPLYILLGFNKLSLTAIIFLYLDACVVVYLFRSKHLPEVFAQFPALVYKKKPVES